MQPTAVVLAGGDPVAPGVAALLPPDALVIAADSGLHQAVTIGVAVDLAIGDFDSVDPGALQAAEAAGTRIERHPADKDVTDLELALDAARREGARRVVVIGGGGGRLDHLLANALLLASPRFDDLRVEAAVGRAYLTVVRDHAELRGEPGDLCSLLALGGPARGVRTTGLRWVLAGDDLHPGSTRGVSNELSADRATVTLDGGVLLAVQPEGITP